MPILDSNIHDEISITDPKDDRRHVIHFPAPVGNGPSEIPRRVAEMLVNKVAQAEGEYVIIEDEPDDSDDQAESPESPESADSGNPFGELLTTDTPKGDEVLIGSLPGEAPKANADTSTSQRSGRKNQSQGQTKN